MGYPDIHPYLTTYMYCEIYWVNTLPRGGIVWKIRPLGNLEGRLEGCKLPRDAFGVNKSERRNPLKNMFLSENMIFRGIRLTLGQQAPESHVSQLQNGVSTSSLPPFIVDLSTIKDYPRSHSFFSMGILEGVKWQTSRAAYNGPKQQWYTDIIPKIRFWLHMLIAEPRENIVWDFPPFETDIIFILVSQGEDWSHFRRNLAAKAGTILWIWIASIYIFLTAFGYIQNYERKVFKFCC